MYMIPMADPNVYGPDRGPQYVQSVIPMYTVLASVLSGTKMYTVPAGYPDEYGPGGCPIGDTDVYGLS